MRIILTLAGIAALLTGSASFGIGVLAQDSPPPVRVGGDISAPVKTKQVNPTYPPEAQRAGVQGVVIVEATIGVDGTVTDVRVVRSVPGLDQAALDAVRQWEFVPTLLQGKPVPLLMTITVNFQLDGGAASAPTGAELERTPGGSHPDLRATPGSADDERCEAAREEPVAIERRETAIRFVEQVNDSQRTVLIARQGKGYAPLAELPAAATAPDGFDVQLVVDGSRYSLSVKDTKDLCETAVFSDQTGRIFVARPHAARRTGPPYDGLR